MKKIFLKPLVLSLVLGALSFTYTSCSDDDNGSGNPNPQTPEGRWITVAGAVMGTTDATPGDGNGGTLIYSVTKEDAKNPNTTIDVFENGFIVPSARTARLQSSENGFTFFNIAYGGGNGGEFSKYLVNGGNSFTQTGNTVSIASYAGTNPRWVKLFDGDKTGVAVNVTSPEVKTDEQNNYLYTRGTATVLSLDMVNAAISGVKTYEIPLSETEEAEGYHIFRLDAPTLNNAGNKLIIGTWMRKTNPQTGENQTEFERLGSKSIVVDYPSLENPQIITSTVGFGDTSGYRSFNAFLADDGNIYQATQRDAAGSHILKINQNNQYDNSYVFSLDDALGITGSYIENWRYAGNGKALVMYTHQDANVSALSGQSQSYLALLDLNAKTAQQVDLPYHTDMYFFQYQGFVVDGNDVYVTISPVGQDGNIYIINTLTGEVTKGAKLVNRPGNHFIGAF